MSFIARVMDVATGGSESPVRRLLVYYVFLVLLTILLVQIFPPFDVLFAGERLEESTAVPQLLNDGMGGGSIMTVIGDTNLSPRLQSILTAFVVMFGALLLMLPVSWVYMAVRRSTGYAQSIVQTMLILPIVVAGIVLVVRNSLALAFSLAGIMAGVRFRNNLRDPRDTVFIFLAIGVGLAAGVQALTVAGVLSLMFNFLTLFAWRTNFGRSPLNLAPKAGWSEPLETLVDGNGTKQVPDRDLLLSLTPATAAALAERFSRVQKMLGADPSGKKKPRYNAVLKVAAKEVEPAREAVETILRSLAKRFRFDGADTPDGKPASLWYLVRLKKGITDDDVISALMAHGRDVVLGAELEKAHAEEKEKDKS